MFSINSFKRKSAAYFLFPILFLCCLSANAASFLDSLNNNEQQYLPVNEAFVFSVDTKNPDTILLNWVIAPDYYLYREPIKISANQAVLGDINIPSGIKKSDPAVGDYHIFENELNIAVPVLSITGNNPVLQISYQGCSAKGYCYPPVNQSIALQATTTTQTNNNAQNSLQLLTEHSFILTLISFFGFGLLLSFTPCVLPMLPILGSIIIGKEHKKTKGFMLALCYVLASATTYAIIGVLAAKIGLHLTATLQQPIILVGFSLLLVLMSLSLFDMFQLRLPIQWQSQIHRLNTRFHNTGWVGAIMLGILSVLVLSPCITPPLVGALSYVSETGDTMLGAAALFALGLGMGAPLILLGTLGAHWLPKSGAWLITVKQLMGILLLALALWMLNTLIISLIYTVLWGIFLIVSSIALGTLEPQKPGWPRLFKSIGFIVLLIGSTLFVKGLPINTVLTSSQPSGAILPNTSAETLIKTPADINALLARAKKENKPVMIKVTADWCIACKIMEKTTFQDSRVTGLLDHFIVATLDVTDNTEQERALQKQLGVFAPPTEVFFNTEGDRLNTLQLVGEINAEDFADHVERIIQVTQGENNALSTSPTVY